MELSKMNQETQLVAVLTVNGAAEVATKIAKSIEPILAPSLAVVQIAIGVATLIWIMRRSKGAKLDNENKERKLRKPRCKK